MALPPSPRPPEQQHARPVPLFRELIPLLLSEGAPVARIEERNGIDLALWKPDGRNYGGGATREATRDGVGRCCNGMAGVANRCGSRTNLQVRHIQPRSQSGDDVEGNLITLCSECHHQIRC